MTVASKTVNQLQSLIASLREVSDPKGKFQAELREKLGDELVRRADQCIDRQSDPYGRPWVRTKRGQPALIGLKGGFRVVHESGGFGISHDKFYEFFHRTGTATLPQRAALPDTDSGGMPSDWEAGLERVADALLKKKLG